MTKNSSYSPRFQEMIFTEEDEANFRQGISLFNNHHFWHAHESWEIIWRRHPEPERIFLQGLIQAAAAYHHHATHRSYTGMCNNFRKAISKLEQFPKVYCGIDMNALLSSLKSALASAEACTSHTFEELGILPYPQLQRNIES